MSGSAPPVIQTFDQAAAMNGSSGPSQLFGDQRGGPSGQQRPPSMHSSSHHSSHSIHSIHSVQGGQSPQVQHPNAVHYNQQQQQRREGDYFAQGQAPNGQQPQQQGVY